MNLFISALILAVACAFITSALADTQAEESIPQFIITTVAGTGELGLSGDGGPALAALIQRPTAVGTSILPPKKTSEFAWWTLTV